MTHIVLDDATRHEIYLWVDGIPLSKPKGYIARDFADGVMLAEVIHHFLPKLVELHNYQSSTNSENKRRNWETLQQKVLKKLQIKLSSDEVDALISAKSGAIERLLIRVRAAIMRLSMRSGDTPAGSSFQGEEQRPAKNASRHNTAPQQVPAPSHAPEPLHAPAPSKATASDPTGLQRQTQPAPAARPVPPAHVQRSPPSHSASMNTEAQEALSMRCEEYAEENSLLRQKIQTLEKLLAVKTERITALEKKIEHLEAKLRRE